MTWPKEQLYWSLFEQFPPITSKGNVWGKQMRIEMLIVQSPPPHLPVQIVTK